LEERGVSVEEKPVQQVVEENSRLMARNPVLEVGGIRKTFKSGLFQRAQEILKGLSFKVYPGEIYGLIGPNGAGKTTTFKSIIGLIFPDEGGIKLFGRHHVQSSAKARIGFLPENPYFYDYLTAKEFLSYHAHLFGMKGHQRNKRIQELIALVGLNAKSGVQLRKYSKGMLQRIGLAQALLNDPDFILLDEPMSGLDPVGRREFRDIILDQKKRGKTILFSSHILSDAEMLCDWVGILVNGKIVKTGRVSDLVSRKVKYYEIACSDVSPEDIPAPNRIISHKGSHLLVQVPEEQDLRRLLSLIKRSGGRLVSLIPHRKSLEDEFIEEIRLAESMAQQNPEKAS
jgi:ABC-2 type transport system ATP-binding protein